MTNNKLPEWRKTLNKSVENYQSMRAWYEENPDNPAAEQDMDTAKGDIEKLLKQYGVLIVLNLMDEIDELQERRKTEAEPIGYMNRFTGRAFSLDEQPGADTDTAVYMPVYTAPPAPVVPDDGRAEFEAWMLKKWGRERQEYDFAMGKFLHGENYADSYTRHMWKAWTESRAALLQSKYRDLSQPVDPQISEYERIMLQAGNSPVTPDGYTLVPVEPTDEMIAAAMNCEDVLFNSDESFCVQYREIYCAMVDTAPALNKGEY